MSRGEKYMSDEPVELPIEVFNIARSKGATAKWPKKRKEPPLEATHPATIPDLREGPFEPLDGWRDDVDEEIGYQGER